MGTGTAVERAGEGGAERPRISQALADTMTISKVFAASGLFPDATEQAKCAVKIMAGQELGVPPFAAMGGVHIIKGKATLAAGTMAAVIKRSGRYNYRVTRLDEDACAIDFFERFDSKWETVGTSTFSFDDAKKAGTGGDNLTKYRRNMLFARAMSNGAKWYCPDVFLGPIYTPEEMGAEVNEEGEVIEGQVVSGRPTVDTFLPKAKAEEGKAPGVLDEANLPTLPAEAVQSVKSKLSDAQKRSVAAARAIGITSRAGMDAWLTAHEWPNPATDDEHKKIAEAMEAEARENYVSEEEAEAACSASHPPFLRRSG